MITRLRRAWRWLENQYTWWWVRRYVIRYARTGVGDAETEALAECLRCPVDFRPCQCVAACHRHQHLSIAEVTEARAKGVAVGRMVQAIRQLAFLNPDEPELVVRAAEGEHILARLRQTGSL